MDLQEHHEMQLMTTYPSGAEMWHCPMCGHLLLTDWPPTYSRIVLVAGDGQAVHLGSTDDQSIELPELAALADDMAFHRPHISADELYGFSSSDSDEALDQDALQPWLNWLRDAGLAE
jgi:hypothetical protein